MHPFRDSIGKSLCIVALGTIFATWPAGPARADFPWPACAGCADPADYADYLFTAPGSPPPLPSELGPYDFRFSSLVDPSLPATAAELGGVAGMSVDKAWQLSTGRPDVLVAHLDSGIVYDEDTARKAALNTGELPLPEGSLVYDANGDGVVNVTDYAGDSRVTDANANGILDPRDLILAFSDSVDDDANGYTDDICGWDAHENDNDPFDAVGYGHGSGQAEDSSAEVNNGGGTGTAPNAMHVPIKVGDSFVADGADFAKGVAYALDRGVTVISEALGALNNPPIARAAVELAFAQGVPMVLSAADEQSYHHNFPAKYGHGFWANSVRGEDGFMVTDPTNLLFNGCTNYGGRASAAVASNSCSSEATGRAAGMIALLYSHARNQIDRGTISPHPITGKALSPTEAYQLLMMTADDIDFSSEGYELSPAGLLGIVLPRLESNRVPSGPGWDKYFGYGRVNAWAALSAIDAGTIPPEADITAPDWFDNIDPTVTSMLDIRGSVAAHRAGNDFSYTVDWACGVDPAEADFAAAGHVLADTALVGSYLDDAVLATLDTSGVAAECGFDVLALPRTEEDDFDESYSITLRVTVEDVLGNVAQARRNVTVHHDADLVAGWPREMGMSGDAPPVLVDMDGDGSDEIVTVTADGAVHVLDSLGNELPGWPAFSDALPIEAGGASWAPGALGSDWHSAILGGAAVGDLDGDGALEVVVADLDGRVYAFADDGSTVSGFPVVLDPTFSGADVRNRANRVDYGVVAAPTLADLDADGDLEILVAAMDRHLYVWDHDGTTHPGFPVPVVDQERMSSVDPVTHKVVWKIEGGGNVGSEGAKLMSSPAVGDLDGDGDLEIVVGSNEEYVRGEDANFDVDHVLFAQLSSSLDLPNGRVYALSHQGSLDPAVATNVHGPFLPGWPVRVGLLLADLLPSVGHGVNAGPVLADIDDDGDDEVFINGNNGPAYLFQGNGISYFGRLNLKDRILDAVIDPATNPGAGSIDLPLSFGLLGSGAAGDLDADGTIELALAGVGTVGLLDAQGPGIQGVGDHQMLAWSADGNTLPGFPQVMEDTQFLISPVLVDVDGDGAPEILEASGGYYLHAFSADGTEPAGWPKFTGGWTTGSAAAGDIDGDGLTEIVASVREGRMYVWDTPATYLGPGAATVAWGTFGHDRHRSGSVNSGVAVAPGTGACRRSFRAILTKAGSKAKDGAAKLKAKGFVNLLGASFDDAAEVEVNIGGPTGDVYSQVFAPGSLAGNSAGTSLKLKGTKPGVSGIKLKRKDFWEFSVKAADVAAAPADDRLFVRLRIGDMCIERVIRCDVKSGGAKLSCKP